MTVFWTKFALDELHHIYDYYKVNVSVLIANNIKESILLSTHQLELQPLSGTPELLLRHLNQGYRYIIRGNLSVILKNRNTAPIRTPTNYNPTANRRSRLAVSFSTLSSQ